MIQKMMEKYIYLFFIHSQQLRNKHILKYF